jgi:hypothetical protein
MLLRELIEDTAWLLRAAYHALNRQYKAILGLSQRISWSSLWYPTGLLAIVLLLLFY